ncbi:MAG: hypothetical protein JO023_20335 [Chloroflexi bacterium]|nr:hypothetical protein [Chloroflexota bacterium]
MAVTSVASRPASGNGWLLAGALLLLAGLVGMLLVGAGAPDQTSLAVLVTLIAAGVWAGAVPLLGARAAFRCALASLIFLNLIRVPVTSPLPYRWRQALYRTDETIEAEVPFDGTSDALRVLAEPHLTSATPGFRLQTSTPVGTSPWTCPWRSGQQWLLVPLGARLTGTVPVTLRVVGQPARDGDYLIVFGENEAGGFLVEPGNTAQPAGATVCSAGA